MNIKKTQARAKESQPHSSTPNELEDFYDSLTKNPEPSSLSEYPTPLHQKKKFSIKKMIFSFFLILAIIGISYGGFVAFKIYFVSKKVSISNENPSLFETFKTFTTSNSISNLKGGETGRINILLLGIAGKGKPGQNLTDTIIVLSINTKTNQVALLSIPRDLYVEVPNAHFWTKINSVYQYGINSSPKNETEQITPLLNVVRDLTNLNVDYYAVLNFDGFQKMIDAIGGINIISERDFYDPTYPGPNYSYETFELKKGFHQLDGATALKYARERHNDPEGDFGRAKRQQQVMQSFKNKFFSVGNLANVFALNNFLNALGDNLKTNIDTTEMGAFLELSKKLDTQNINNMVLDAWNKDSLLKISRSVREAVGASALVPRVGNYSEIQELAQNIFDLNEIKRKREEIAKENASIVIINQSGDFSLTEKIRKLLSVNLNYKNIVIKKTIDKTIASKTIAYDLTGGTKLFTIDELVKKLPASTADTVPENIRNLVIPKISVSKNSAVTELPIVIVLGKDLSGIYNIEEGTMQDLESSRDNEEMLNLKK